MIAWRNEAEAIGYAASQLEDALSAVQRHVPFAPVDGISLALESIADAIAALVLVRHTRQGDALVTIDQLTAELTDTRAAQPVRRCCQTYAAEAHAPRCQAASSMALRPMPDRVTQGLR